MKYRVKFVTMTYRAWDVDSPEEAVAEALEKMGKTADDVISVTEDTDED